MMSQYGSYFQMCLYLASQLVSVTNRIIYRIIEIALCSRHASYYRIKFSTKRIYNIDNLLDNLVLF